MNYENIKGKNQEGLQKMAKFYLLQLFAQFSK
jgi:hypothetical protein